MPEPWYSALLQDALTHLRTDFKLELPRTIDDLKPWLWAISVPIGTWAFVRWFRPRASLTYYSASLTLWRLPVERRLNRLAVRELRAIVRLLDNPKDVLRFATRATGSHTGRSVLALAVMLTGIGVGLGPLTLFIGVGMLYGAQASFLSDMRGLSAATAEVDTLMLEQAEKHLKDLSRLQEQREAVMAGPMHWIMPRKTLAKNAALIKESVVAQFEYVNALRRRLGHQSLGSTGDARP